MQLGGTAEDRSFMGRGGSETDCNDRCDKPSWGGGVAQVQLKRRRGGYRSSRGETWVQQKIQQGGGGVSHAQHRHRKSLATGQAVCILRARRTGLSC